MPLNWPQRGSLRWPRRGGGFRKSQRLSPAAARLGQTRQAGPKICRWRRPPSAAQVKIMRPSPKTCHSPPPPPAGLSCPCAVRVNFPLLPRCSISCSNFNTHTHTHTGVDGHAGVRQAGRRTVTGKRHCRIFLATNEIIERSTLRSRPGDKATGHPGHGQRQLRIENRSKKVNCQLCASHVH